MQNNETLDPTVPKRNLKIEARHSRGCLASRRGFKSMVSGFAVKNVKPERYRRC
jgi:hypothetical protein